MSLKIVMRVKISPSSIYYGQGNTKNIEGTVQGYYGNLYTVVFDNKYSNEYRLVDLEIIDSEMPLEYKCICSAPNIKQVQEEGLYGECSNCLSLIGIYGEVLQ